MEDNSFRRYMKLRREIAYSRYGSVDGRRNSKRKQAILKMDRQRYDFLDEDSMPKGGRILPATETDDLLSYPVISDSEPKSVVKVSIPVVDSRGTVYTQKEVAEMSNNGADWTTWK